MTWTTADLWDVHAEKLSACRTQFVDFGGKPWCSGPARTVRCHADNSLVHQLVASSGDGSILVVDAGADLGVAMLGNKMAERALANGWAGIIVNGAVRDRLALAAIDLAIKAIGTTPARAGKRDLGELDVHLEFGGIRIRPGDYVYADGDGVTVSPSRLIEPN